MKHLHKITEILPLISFMGAAIGVCYAFGLFFMIGFHFIHLLSWDDFLKFSITGMFLTYLGMATGFFYQTTKNKILTKNKNEKESFTSNYIF